LFETAKSFSRVTRIGAKFELVAQFEEVPACAYAVSFSVESAGVLTLLSEREREGVSERGRFLSAAG
jgi:hypothetical protein